MTDWGRGGIGHVCQEIPLLMNQYDFRGTKSIHPTAKFLPKATTLVDGMPLDRKPWST